MSLDFIPHLMYITRMETDQNPAVILKKISEALMPLAEINKEWEEAWVEVIDALDRHVPLNDS
jgi:hypothetical protein